MEDGKRSARNDHKTGWPKDRNSWAVEEFVAGLLPLMRRGKVIHMITDQQESIAPTNTRKQFFAQTWLYRFIYEKPSLQPKISLDAKNARPIISAGVF